MARHILAILSAVHGAGRAHGALHPTAVEVEYEGSERVRLKILPTPMTTSDDNKGPCDGHPHSKTHIPRTPTPNLAKWPKW